MGNAVFDASALIALLLRADGFETVRAHLPGGYISSITLVELFHQLRRHGSNANHDARVIAALNIQSVPFDNAQALKLASKWPETLDANCSLPGIVSLCLATSLHLPLITDNDDLLEHDTDVEVILINPRESSRE